MSHDIAREFGLSQRRALEVLADEQLQSYHYSLSANLFPDCRPRRVQLRLSCVYIIFLGQTRYIYA
jgi:hypothetical protein